MKTNMLIGCAVLLAGCATPQQKWSFHPPFGKGSPWARVIPVIAFSNTPLPEAVATLEQLASSLDGDPIKISIAGAPEGQPQTRDPSAISFRAESICVLEAVRIVAHLSNLGAIFNRNEAILGARGHGDGSVTINLRGQCRDAGSSRPVKTLTLICTRVQHPFDRPTTSVHDVRTDRDGNFEVSLLVRGYSNFLSTKQHYAAYEDHPDEQEVDVIAIAEGYYPARHSIRLTPTELTYLFDVSFSR